MKKKKQPPAQIHMVSVKPYKKEYYNKDVHPAIIVVIVTMFKTD